MSCTVKQDLHIHTNYSKGDKAIEPQQSLDLIKEIAQSEIIGISDHVPGALMLPFDYYIFHCRDRASEYRAAENLHGSGKPVIISHPMMIGADLNNVPTGCLIEVNNRYVWKADYMTFYAPHLNRFKFVLGSDAHQPNWLNHKICRHAAEKMVFQKTLLFSGPFHVSLKKMDKKYE